MNPREPRFVVMGNRLLTLRGVFAGWDYAYQLHHAAVFVGEDVAVQYV